MSSLPHHFELDDMRRIILRKEEIEDQEKIKMSLKYRQYEPTLGLLLRLRSGSKRALQSFVNQAPYNQLEQSAILYQLYNYYVKGTDKQIVWTEDDLWKASTELLEKSKYINPNLKKDLDFHPLYDLHKDSNMLQFDDQFYAAVKAYHLTLQRPSSFSSDVEADHSNLNSNDSSSNSNSNDGKRKKRKVDNDENNVVGTNSYFTSFPNDVQCTLDLLMQVPREKCDSCGSNRIIYCGKCGGKRMLNGAKVLPTPLELPFDIVLCMHWHESPLQSTGMHVVPLCVDHTLTIVDWYKEEEGVCKSDAFIESLDPSIDIVLFPLDGAINAAEINWNIDKDATDVNVIAHNDNNKIMKKKRLIVLEASWKEAIKMAKRIVRVRQQKNLSSIPFVTLDDNVVGKFWKFQDLSHSSVSTIEAIAYTIHAAGASITDYHNLLLLFRLQLLRVQSAERTNRRKNVPRIFTITGTGEYAWNTLDN